jgi:hypothetical protein
VNLTRQAVTSAITLVQIAAGSSAGLQILEVRLAQSSSTTSTMLPIQINRKSAAATVTSFTPLLTNPNDAAAKAVGGSTATGVNASGEGTDGDILVQDVWNYLSGWLYQPIPEQRVQVAPSGIIALKLPVAPTASITLTATVTFQELE